MNNDAHASVIKPPPHNIIKYDKVESTKKKGSMNENETNETSSSLTIGVVSAISALGARNQGFYRSMDILNRFLREKRLTAKNPKLCERLRSYYLFRHGEGDDATGWTDIVTHTSHEMQGEVVNELHAEWLSRMSYFHGVDKQTGKKWQVDNEFKLELALSMKIEMVAPMEKIFKEESPIDNLFVIQRGLVGCRGRVLHEGDAFGDDVLIHYSPRGLGDAYGSGGGGAEGAGGVGGGGTGTGIRARGYRATALAHVVLMVFPGDKLHRVLSRPKYEYVRDQVKKKMFVWQLKHVFIRLKETLREAVRQPTFADGMQVLVTNLGEDQVSNLPTVRDTYMRLREEAGDDTIVVVKVFRRLLNRKKFVATIEEAVARRKRLERLWADASAVRNMLEPIGAGEYTNLLISQGVTIRTIKQFSSGELVAVGLPLILARRIVDAASTYVIPPEDLPESRTTAKNDTGDDINKSSTKDSEEGGDEKQQPQQQAREGEGRVGSRRRRSYSLAGGTSDDKNLRILDLDVLNGTGGDRSNVGLTSSSPSSVGTRRAARLSSGGGKGSKKELLKYLEERRAVAEAVFRSGGAGGGGVGSGLLGKLDAGRNALTWQMGMGPGSVAGGSGGGLGGGGSSGSGGSLEALLTRVMADQGRILEELRDLRSSQQKWTR